MVKAGELREKIAVHRPIRVSNGSGGYDTTYGVILNTFAKIVEQRSNPEMVANQENINNYIHFRMRYRPDVFLRIADRLVWRGFNFTVNNFKVDPMRTQIDIYVNSEIETSSREASDYVHTDPFPNLDIYEDNGYIILEFEGHELTRYLKVT